MSELFLREKVHELVDKADDRLLKIVFALMSEYDDYGYELTVSGKKEVYKRINEMKSGKVKGLSLEEVVSKARVSLAERHKKS